MKSVLKKIRPLALVLWLVLLMLVILIVVLARLAPKDEFEEAEPEPAILVRVLEVEARTVRETVTLPGRVEANISTRLASEKGGLVEALHVDRGDTVSKGQILLQVDDRLWQTQARQARIELEDAQRELERWEQMRETGSVSASDYDAVRYRYDTAVVAAETADIHVDQCRLESPFDGVVDARMVEAGEFLAEGQIVFRLLSLAPLNVQLNLPERDAGAVRMGERKQFSVPALDGDSFEGRVAFVAQEASPATYTYALELVVDAEPEGLRPGMIVEVEIQRARHEEAIVVPLAAVIPRRGEHVVFVVQDGTAVRRVVTLERVAGREAVLASGLAAGQQLVVEGHRGLQDGTRVEIVDALPEADAPAGTPPADPVDVGEADTAAEATPAVDGQE